MGASEPRKPGPFRTTDGSSVSFAEAKVEWARIGYYLLANAARCQGAQIVYQACADAMRDESGIQTRTPMRNWVGKPLALIAEMCVENREPQLTSLVVSQGTGEVGPSYAYTYTLAAQTIPVNLQRAAADVREQCYDHFARHNPVGWDATRLKGRTALRPTRPRTVTRPEPEPRAVCRICNIELPQNGICYCCD
jgi:hypothetical protein